LTRYNILYVSHHETSERLRGSKNKANSAEHNDEQQNRKDEAARETATPSAIAMMPAL
jgi:hypothetical protein